VLDTHGDTETRQEMPRVRTELAQEVAVPPQVGRTDRADHPLNSPCRETTKVCREASIPTSSALALLGLPDDVPVVTRDLVERAKPDPHLFLAAAHRLGVDPAHCFVVGDSVWDLLAAQRAGALGIGLLSGGYGREELERSGAYRVYADPAEMLTRLEEVGVRPIR
jgi:beta-phosphoglucomutase-like phosphatase (HAD superfamily)